MATWQKSQQLGNATGEELGAVIDLFHEAMLAVGCVQTDDTGQVDSETVPDPALSTPFNLGFRTYELNDSLSDEFPIVLRADFKSQRFTSSSTYQAPSIKISAGFATNGAGTFVGGAVDLGDPWGTAASSGGPVTTQAALSAACKLDGYLFAVIGVGAYASPASSVTPALFTLCRTHDAKGVPDGRGLVLFSPSNTSSMLTGQDSLSVGAVMRSDVVSASSMDPFSVGGMRTIGGLMVAHPWDTRVIEATSVPPYLIAIPQEFNTGGSLHLSSDGWASHPYLPIPTVHRNVTGEAANRLVITVNRYRYNFPNAWHLAARFE